MKKLLCIGILAAALSVGLVSAASAEPEMYKPATLDQTGFAPSDPISVPGYSPTLVDGPDPGINNGGGTNGNGFAVNGNEGDKGGQHNNQRTDFNSDYDFRRPYRFTGDNQLGRTEKSRQQSLQGMLDTKTGTDILSPPGGKSFAGPSSFGFKGKGGSFYYGIYPSKGFSGGALPGTGTGEIDINITDSGY